METHELEFMYKGGDAYHFMNTENYDQTEMDEESSGRQCPVDAAGDADSGRVLQWPPDRYPASELAHARGCGHRAR